MRQQYIIWDELMSEEDIQAAMDEYREDPEYASLSDDTLRRLVEEDNYENLECEKANLSGIDLPTGLVITGLVQRWNGIYFGALAPDKTPETISKCLRGFCDSQSYLTIYVEDGELLIREAHHDGVNLYQVRAWRPEIDDGQKDAFWDDFCGNEDIGKHLERMTFRVGDLIGDIYGWEFDGRPACIAQKTKAD